MDRNLWLAVALSVAVYAVWFGLFDKKINPPRPPSRPIAAAPQAPSSSPPAPENAQAALAASEAVALDDAKALISPKGAALAGYSFQGPISRVELVADAGSGLLATFPELSFKRDTTAKNKIVYVAMRPNGARIAKEFLPAQNNVLPRLIIAANNPSPKPMTLDPWTLSVGPGLGTVDSARKENLAETNVIALAPNANHIETLKPGVHADRSRWIALQNRYFMAALMPSPSQFEPATVSATALTLTAKPVTLPPGGTFVWEIPYYLGAKSHTALARYGIGLEKSIDYGILRDIGRPIFSALRFLSGVTRNWGWSIILLTLALQILLFPLTYKSLKAASMMRKVQPEIAKLQQRYKDDPTRLNSEMMALYKKAGANPLSGCLPMLMQMPIFIALYNVLQQSWELHGAGWILWIRDLSSKDPYYVLPVIMGALMFAQSKLNPPAGDPTQQQIMMLMPLIFTVMFAQASSGLVLYWLMNSLVSTLLQLALNDRLNADAA